MDEISLHSAIESILFASDKPITVERLKEVLEEAAPNEEDLESALNALEAKYQDPSFGFEVRKAQGGYQFCTKQVNAQWVRKFLESRPFRLSRSALETLSVIAYRQPITRAEIDKVRGIDSSHLLRTLIEKGIVKMAGKADVPGRPVQYGTTQKFLELVGLKSTNELPPLSELKELEGDAPTERDRIEDDMTKFIEADSILEDRAKELEAGLEDIGKLMDSAGVIHNEVFKSALHAEVATENQNATTSFQAMSRGWKKPKKKKEEDPVSENPPPSSEELAQ